MASAAPRGAAPRCFVSRPFRSSSRSWMAWFSSARLKKRRLRRRARTQRSTIWTLTSTFALSRGVNRAILFQNAVDDIRERRQLRALRRLASPISRRFRMQQYLGNRLAIDPELARSFPSAQTLTMTRQSHSSIKIHSVHPPPSIRSILTKAIDGPILVRRRNRPNRPLHWGIIAPPFSVSTPPRRDSLAFRSLQRLFCNFSSSEETPNNSNCSRNISWKMSRTHTPTCATVSKEWSSTSPSPCR